MCFTLFEKNHNHHTAIVYFLHFVIHGGVWVQAASITVQMMSNLTPLSRSENLRHHQVKNWFYPFKLMGKGLLWGCMNVPPKITLALLPHTFVELQLCLVPRKCSTPRSSSRYKLCYCQLAFEAQISEVCICFALFSVYQKSLKVMGDCRYMFMFLEHVNCERL